MPPTPGAQNCVEGGGPWKRAGRRKGREWEASQIVWQRAGQAPAAWPQDIRNGKAASNGEGLNGASETGVKWWLVSFTNGPKALRFPFFCTHVCQSMWPVSPSCMALWRIGKGETLPNVVPKMMRKYSQYQPSRSPERPVWNPTVLVCAMLLLSCCSAMLLLLLAAGRPAVPAVPAAALQLLLLVGVRWCCWCGSCGNQLPRQETNRQTSSAKPTENGKTRLMLGPKKCWTCLLIGPGPPNARLGQLETPWQWSADKAPSRTEEGPRRWMSQWRSNTCKGKENPKGCKCQTVLPWRGPRW